MIRWLEFYLLSSVGLEQTFITLLYLYYVYMFLKISLAIISFNKVKLLALKICF